MSTSTTTRRVQVASVAAACLGLIPASPGIDLYELPPISYSDATASTKVERVIADIEANPLRWTHKDDKETLRQLLDALDVPIASQVLVFSKTSLQRKLIHPRNPRALYFNDEAYIGWVPGGAIELTYHDPHIGPVFYRFDPARADSPPDLFRDDSCLNCHAGARTDDVPGVFIRSIYPANDGTPILEAGSFLTTVASPLQERWGGWYVTGKHGRVPHMGNRFAKRDEMHGAVMSLTDGNNVESLSKHFDTSRYLTDTSDIIALMVLEHQCNMHNRLTAGSLEVRQALYRYRSLSLAAGEDPEHPKSGSAWRVICHHADRILKEMLFREETPLLDGGVEGSDAFQTAFSAQAKEAEDGRSLRDMQGYTRLFKYRCSYMIHSDVFAQLPEVLKERIYDELYTGLTADTPTGAFDHLSNSERKRIRSILTDTHEELAARWAVLAQAGS